MNHDAEPQRPGERELEQIRRELLEINPPFLCCSCGGALSIDEYIEHRRMGHDSGGLELR